MDPYSLFESPDRGGVVYPKPLTVLSGRASLVPAVRIKTLDVSRKIRGIAQVVSHLQAQQGITS